MRRKNDDERSLSHARWNCQYRIVFTPKHRRKVISRKLRRDVGVYLRRLCDYKGVEIIEVQVCPDHIHMLAKNPLTLYTNKIDIITNPNSSKIVKFFDDLEETITTENSKELIPVILTDRDPCFSDIEGICFSKITGAERCKLFFCDPYVSNQKPNIENMNNQIRKFFPKGKSVDNHIKETVKRHNITLLNTPVKSLDGYTYTQRFIHCSIWRIFI